MIVLVPTGEDRLLFRHWYTFIFFTFLSLWCHSYLRCLPWHFWSLENNVKPMNILIVSLCREKEIPVLWRTMDEGAFFEVLIKDLEPVVVVLLVCSSWTIERLKLEISKGKKLLYKSDQYKHVCWTMKEPWGVSFMRRLCLRAKDTWAHE